MDKRIDEVHGILRTRGSLERDGSGSGGHRIRIREHEKPERGVVMHR